MALSPLSQRSDLLDPMNQKPLRHKWQQGDRQVLCLLYRLYSNPIKDKTAIFNYLFRDCLEREGFQNGLASTTIQTQWHDMRAGANGNDLWRDINVDKTLAECRAKYEDLNGSIEDAAYALGLELCLCLQSSDVTKMHSYRIGKRAQSINQVREMLNDAMPATKVTEAEERPKKLRRTRPASDSRRKSFVVQPTHITTSILAPVGGGTPVAPLSVSSRIQHDREAAQLPQVNVGWRPESRKDIPRLLFRFSDDLSAAKGPFLKNTTGFVAGSFANSVEDIPTLPAELLQALVLVHLTPSQRITQTPFISFFSGILPTLHRALRSASNSYVTVVDSHIVEKAHKEQLGEGQQTIYFVCDLVARFDLKLKANYTGPTEYLVYGVVPQNAIVGIFKISNLIRSPIYNDGVLSVLQLDLIKHNEYARNLSSKLEKLAHPMLYGTGEVVGSLLAFGNTKPEYIKTLAMKIASWWRFGGYKTGSTSESYTDYMTGVWTAYGSRTAHSVGLEEEEEEEDPGVSDEFADQVAHLDTAEVVPAAAESSDDERDLIDLQFELDCPELCANHHEAFEDKCEEDRLTQFGDIRSDDLKDSSQGPPTRASSLDTFAEDLFQVAEERCSPPPPTAHVREREGSPWRRITPTMLLRTRTTPATTAAERPFYLDFTDD